MIKPELVKSCSKSLGDRAPHQNENLRLHSNHTIERAVINQLGPLGDGENDGMQIKKVYGVVQYAY
jgi:hypothetical protein